MPEDENEVLSAPEEELTGTETTETNNDEEESDMPDTPVKKLKRSALIHYLDTSFALTAASAAWSLIGKHVADLSVEMNADTETIKNILDEATVIDNGYEPAFDVDTYYADPSDGDFYTKLKDITMNRKTGDDCRTLVLEVIVDKETGPFDAWVEEAIIKPTSYGGAQGGVRIPYRVSFAGNRVKGTVTITNKVPTFTADT